MTSKFQSEREVVDAALQRPLRRQRLGPALEARYFDRTKKANERHALVSLFIVVIVDAALLLLDSKAGAFSEAIKLKLLVNFPLVALAVVAIVADTAQPLKVGTRIVAISSVVLTTVILGLSVSSPFNDRYFMCAGLLGFAVNMVFAAGLLEAALQTAANVVLYAGLPVSGLFGPSSSTDIVLAFSAMMVMTLRVVRQRERANKNAFLLHVRDQLQTVEMSALIDELTASSLTDALTGVANRRGFELKLANTVRASHASAHRVSLVMIDVDHFKLFNDTGGHSGRGEGAAGSGAAVDRDAGAVSRYGGEEFVVILSEAQNGGNDARVVAEGIRRSVEERAIPHPGIPGGVVTVSIGVATMRPGVDGVGAATMLDAADVALYRAKRSGRNRVNVSGHLRSQTAA